MKRLALIGVAFIVPVVLALSAPAQEKVQVQEHAGSTFVMEDSFEYTLIDYGLGQVQLRPTDKANSLSPQVFWAKFRIVNRDEHLIRQHKYIGSFSGPLNVRDNWGNTYWLKHLDALDVGGSWYGVTLPIPGGDPNEPRKDKYKPGESSWDLLIVRASEFVNGIIEFRIYLAGHEFHNPKAYYFRIARPLSRQRNLIQGQADPEPSELQVTEVTETFLPAQVPVPKQKR